MATTASNNQPSSATSSRLPYWLTAAYWDAESSPDFFARWFGPDSDDEEETEEEEAASSEQQPVIDVKNAARLTDGTYLRRCLDEEACRVATDVWRLEEETHRTTTRTWGLLLASLLSGVIYLLPTDTPFWIINVLSLVFFGLTGLVALAGYLVPWNAIAEMKPNPSKNLPLFFIESKFDRYRGTYTIGLRSGVDRSRAVERVLPLGPCFSPLDGSLSPKPLIAALEETFVQAHQEGWMPKIEFLQEEEGKKALSKKSN